MRVLAMSSGTSPQFLGSGCHLVVGELIDEVVEVAAVIAHGLSLESLRQTGADREAEGRAA